MNLPDTLTITEETVRLKEKDVLLAFCNKSGKANIGMPYWYKDDCIYLFQLTTSTDKDLLRNQVRSGRIYIRKSDHETYQEQLRLVREEKEGPDA